MTRARVHPVSPHVHAAALLLLCALSPLRAGAATPAPINSASADTAFAHQDWAGAVRAYEALVKADASRPRFWYRLAFARQSLSRFPEAIDAYRHAEALGAPAQVVRFNVACAFSRMGQVDSSLAVLQRLMDAGYGQTQPLETDADLAAARADARFAAVLERARHNAQPCSYREDSRQFDFWIGDWAVTQNTPGGGAAGDSHVELILNQCVIFENWTGRIGGSGKSFNAFNADLGCWQQNWMDDRGDVTNYSDGHFADGKLVFHAEKKDARGGWQKHRLTFFRIDADHVRQLGENSTDGGSTWAVNYDLLYTRKR